MLVYGSWIIGALLVLTDGARRFNTAAPSSSMTVLRYYLSIGSYLTLLSVLFVIMGIMPDAGFVKNLVSTSDSSDLSTSGPLLSALILTVLLPNIPILQHFDKWLRTTCQYLGSTPGEKGRTRKQLLLYLRSGLVIPSAMVERIAETLADFEEPNIDMIDQSLDYGWSRIVCLKLQIDDWECDSNKRYQKCVRSKEYTKIDSTYKTLANRALRAVRCVKSMTEIMDEKNACSLTEECRRTFKNQADTLLESICAFISSGVFHCELRKSDRDKRLENMGFVGIPKKLVSLSLDQVIGVVIVIWVLMLTIMTIITTQMNLGGIGYVLFITTMVSTIYGVSIIAAMLPKTHWEFANITEISHRPFRAYLLSGAIAVVGAYVVVMLFKSFYFGSLEYAWWHTRDLTYPWFGLTFVFAVITAYIADDNVRSLSEIPSWLRFVESASSGLILAVASIPVYMLLHELYDEMDKAKDSQLYKICKDVTKEFPCELPPFPSVIAISAVIGLVAGFLVPHLYRQRLRDNSEKPDNDMLDVFTQS